MKTVAATHVLLALAAAAWHIPTSASAFAPIRPFSIGGGAASSKYATKRSRWSPLGVGGPGASNGGNDDDAGSGIYYDADPSRMNLAAAAAAQNKLALQQQGLTKTKAQLTGRYHTDQERSQIELPEFIEALVYVAFLYDPPRHVGEGKRKRKRLLLPNALEHLLQKQVYPNAEHHLGVMPEVRSG